MFCVMEIHVSNDPVSTIRVFCHRGILKQSKVQLTFSFFIGRPKS